MISVSGLDEKLPTFSALFVGVSSRFTNMNCNYSAPLELLMIQSDKLAYLTDLSGSRGRTSGETALSAA